MSASSGPSIQTDGLVFDYDMSNTQKSFKGPPATNLIPYSQDYGSNGNFMANWTGNLFSNWINSVVTTGYQAPDDSYTANLITGYYSRWTASITASVSTTYTFSIWLKNYSLTSSIYLHVAFGLNGSLVNYNNVDTFQPSTIANWTRCSWTVTSPASGINQIQCGVEFGGSKSASAGPYAVLVWGAQLETGSYPTPYIPSLGASSSRSSTQAILDLTNKNTITASSLTYAADGTFSFNGSNNFVDGGNSSDITITNNITVSAWVRRTAYGGSNSMIIRRNDRDTYALQLGISTPEVWWKLYFGSSTWGQTATTSLALNEWANIVGTYDRTTMRLYKNGVQVQTLAATSAIDYSGSAAPNLIIGRDDPISGRYFAGNIPSIQIYNRALSATEIQQAFNAQRTRYGI